MPVKTLPAATLITPEVILSWPSIFTPRIKLGTDGKPKGAPKYECVFLVPATTDIKALKEAALALAKATYPDVEELIKEGRFKWPFRRCTAKDVSDYKYPAGGQFFRASSKDKPGVVDQAVQPVLDAERIYPGVHVRASVRPYLFDQDGSKGVTFNLNNLQILGDGPRLDNRKTAEEEFDSVTVTGGEGMELDATAGNSLLD